MIACGALAREITALRAANRWDGLHLQCLPAELHNRPEHIPEAVRDAIPTPRPLPAIFVAYGDCGTGGRLDAVLAAEGVQRLPGAHCYAFYAGEAAFEALAQAEPGTFYVTDFLRGHFDRLVTDGLASTATPSSLRRTSVTTGASFSSRRRRTPAARAALRDGRARRQRGWAWRSKSITPATARSHQLRRAPRAKRGTHAQAERHLVARYPLAGGRATRPRDGQGLLADASRRRLIARRCAPDAGSDAYLADWQRSDRAIAATTWPPRRPRRARGLKPPTVMRSRWLALPRALIADTHPAAPAPQRPAAGSPDVRLRRWWVRPCAPARWLLPGFEASLLRLPPAVCLRSATHGSNARSHASSVRQGAAV